MNRQITATLMLLFSLCLPVVAWSQDEKGTGDFGEGDLPKLEELDIPSMSDLLRKDPVDWVVLKSEEKKVIVTQQLFPRPNTLEKLAEQLQQSYQWPKPRNDKEKDRQAKQREDLQHLNIVLADSKDAKEFFLHVRFVEEIVYHEDLMLKRIDLLIKDGKLRDAYEMLYTMDKQVPGWNGIEERQQDLIFREADIKFEQKRPQEALAYLEQLHQRNPEYKGLSSKLGEVSDSMISAAHGDEDYRRARFFLQRLQTVEAKHPIAVKWQQELSKEASALLEKSREHSEKGEYDIAVDVARRAAHIWPAAPGTDARMEQVVKRWQTLRVGVTQLAGEESSYPLPTRADLREQRLLEAKLFEIDYVDSSPHYRTRFFERWEPEDLGERTVFHLRQNRQSWEALPVITSGSLINTLSARLDPKHPAFDERLATYIESLTVQSPFQFTVKFAKAPLRIEALLNMPVEQYTENTGFGGAITTKKLSRQFQIHQASPVKRVYRRVVPQNDGLAEYRLAEVVEFKFPNDELALQALLRGEISMLAQVPPHLVQDYEKHPEFTVEPYSLPLTHVLQVNPKSKPLRNQELRRALGYALQKQKILEEVVLAEAGTQYGRLVSGPFPSSSYANNALVQPIPFDLTVAYALALVGKKGLKVETLPTLKMVCPPNPVARAAAERMVQDWKRIKINVELVDQTAEPPADWDLLYRTVKMADPVTELWPFFTIKDRADISDLYYLPDWLRAQLVELDNVGDWDSAIDNLQDLHRYLITQGEIIALWEVDEFFAYRTASVTRSKRRNFSNSLTLPLQTYQEIERWTIKPWYHTSF